MSTTVHAACMHSLSGERREKRRLNQKNNAEVAVKEFALGDFSHDGIKNQSVEQSCNLIAKKVTLPGLCRPFLALSAAAAES